MAVTASDVPNICSMLLYAMAEDASAIGRAIVKLEAAYPAISWRASLQTAASTHPPYLADGLDLPWFQGVVVAAANAYKAAGN